MTTLSRTAVTVFTEHSTKSIVGWFLIVMIQHHTQSACLCVCVCLCVWDFSKRIIVFCCKLQRIRKAVNIEPMWSSFKHSSLTEDTQVVFSASSVIKGSSLILLQCSVLYWSVRFYFSHYTLSSSKLMAYGDSKKIKYGRCVSWEEFCSWTQSYAGQSDATLCKMTQFKNPATLQWKQEPELDQGQQ